LIGGIRLAKTDNPADYEAHLQEHINNTVANLHEAENYLDENAGEITTGKKQVIEAKNDRREESIKGFMAGKKDEAQR
jgi:small acid-soluble spore protein (thioredoxin-like protein)